MIHTRKYGLGRNTRRKKITIETRSKCKYLKDQELLHKPPLVKVYKQARLQWTKKHIHWFNKLANHY